MGEDEEERMLRDLQYDPFFDSLIKEFGFTDTDPAALIEMLIEERCLCDDRLGDTLDELDKPLGKVIRLLENDLNAYRIWRRLAGRDLAETDRELFELPDRLREIGAAAKAAHRKRDPAQPTAPLMPQARLDLRNFAEKVARFWITATGKRFEQRHELDAWPPRSDGVEEPKNKKGGTYFVFQLIERYRPEQVKDARKILREVTQDPEFRKVNPPPPGKPRGRPRRGLQS
jgi:hypothetical protein